MEDTQKKKTGDLLVKKIKKIFPENAEYKSSVDFFKGYMCSIAWKLGNDQNRPNKRSNPILLNFTDELLEDYEASCSKSDIEIKILSDVKKRASEFDPEKKLVSIYANEWIIDS